MSRFARAELATLSSPGSGRRPSDRSLRDLANLVKGPIRQFDAAITDCQPAVGIVDDGDPLADRGLGLLAWLQDEDGLKEGSMSLEVLAIDAGKRSFHLYGIDADGVIFSSKVSRAKLVATKAFSRHGKGAIIFVCRG
jgi:hypothetical protein